MTPKQSRFTAEYLANGFNATRAAISAGYSKKTASSIGEENLRKPEISAAIEEGTKRIMDRLEVTADLVVQEIAKMAFFDPRKLFNDDGSLKMISQIDDHSAAALAGFEVCELFDGTGDQKHAYGLLKKVKLADKSKNLEMLGRYFKLFTADREDPTDAKQITTLIIDL
jgi:phage terminase small subunit